MPSLSSLDTFVAVVARSDFQRENRALDRILWEKSESGRPAPKMKVKKMSSGLKLTPRNLLSPGPAAYFPRGHCSKNSPSWTFGDARDAMYDRRTMLRQSKLGPGDYYNPKNASSFGERPRLTVYANDRRIRLFRRKEGPSPAAYSPNDRIYKSHETHGFGEPFIRTHSRPPWTSSRRSRDVRGSIEAVQKIKSSVVGPQESSTTRSAPTFRFCRSQKSSVKCDVGERTPGVGSYELGTYSVGHQSLSPHCTAPSFGFGSAPRFADAVYRDYADTERRNGGIRRRKRR